MAKTAYLCGPITGLPNNNKEAFEKAFQKWGKLGYFVINPHDLCEGLVSTHKGTAEELWRNCMKRDISIMVRCDAVVLLDGWNNSRGATIERNLAQQLGIDCILDSSVIVV
jgi:hypothetical protein